MSRLSKHLRYLLERHGKVTLPGIGMFASDYFPAFYDEESRLYHPQKLSYYFNGKIDEDDNLLINSYIRQLRATPQEALLALHKDIEKVMDLLDEYSEVYLPGLGTLFIDDQDEVNFEYGRSLIKGNLDSLLPALPLQSKQELESKPLETADCAQPTEDYILRKRNYYYLPISKTFSRIAASFLLVLTVGFFALYPNIGSNNPSTASIVPMETTSDLPKVLESRVDIVAEDAVEISDDTQNEDAMVSEVENNDKFFLIVGVFRSQKEVETFMAQESDKGFKLEAVEGKNRTLVSVASSPVAADMYSLKSQPEIKAAFPDAWVWEKR